MTWNLDRRQLLGVTGAGVAAWTLSPAPTAAAAPNFGALRQRWRDLTLGTGFDPNESPYAESLSRLGAQAGNYAQTMRPAKGSLWPDLVYTAPPPGSPDAIAISAKMTASFSRLLTMANAYAQPNTGHTGSTQLSTAIATGLDHLNREVYGDGIRQFGNWWEFQIGSPQRLMSIMTAVYDQLDSDLRRRLTDAAEYYVPNSLVDRYEGNSTGANRVDLCRVMIHGGIVAEDADRLRIGRDGLSDVFPYVTTGDGFYADGSFVQHLNIPYIGSYGVPLVGGLSLLFALLQDSEFEVVDPGRTVFFEMIERSVRPAIYNGALMAMLTGRGIARANTQEAVRGHAMVAAVALLADGVEPSLAAKWRTWVRGWLERNTVSDPLTSVPEIPHLVRLRQIAADPNLKPAPEAIESRVFAQMDRVTHRRAGWCVGLSMASRRIGHYEVGNGENLRGYHTGSGWLQWWTNETMGHYSDNFWPTANPYRLAGTTVSRKPLADGEGGAWNRPAPDTDWVGGASDGEFSVVGQHLKGLSSTLDARKSWFCLDSAVVCIGAGITATDGFAVDSTLEHRQIKPGAVFTVDATPAPAEAGWSRELRPRWAHLEGHGGYLIGNGDPVLAIREDRTGRWRDISTDGSTQAITRQYLTMVYEHGVDPVGASYEYVLLPGATATQTEAAAQQADQQFRVLANRAGVQALFSAQLNVFAANFWAAGQVRQLSANAPASVLIREHGNGTATICVADPARSNTSLRVTWARPVTEVLERAETVTAVATGSKLVVDFGDLTRVGGATQQLLVRLR